MTYDKILRNLIIAGSFLVPFIPMIVANSMFFPFITGKNFSFRIIVEIIFGLWIILALRNPAYRPKFSPILISFSIFVFVIFLADLFGVNPAKSFWSNFERMEGFVTLIHLLLYFVVLGSVFKAKELWKWFFHVSIGVSIYSILFGIFQLEGLAVINQGGDRVDGKFGNATYLAVYMLFHIFITAWYLFTKDKNLKYIVTSALLGFGVFVIELLGIINTIKNPPNNQPAGVVPEELTMFLWFSLAGLALFGILLFKRKDEVLAKYVTPALYVLVLLFQGGILYMTATRGAILGLLGGAFLAAILIAIFDREKPLLRKVSAGIIIAVLLIVGTFIANKDTDFVQNNLTLKRFADISLDSGTVRARFTIWSMAWEGIKERPLLGWGQENFNLIFNQEYDPVLYRDEPWFDRVHNIVFDWLVSGGILGFLAYVSIPLFLLFAIWRAPEDRISRTEKSLLTGLIAAYGFHNIFVFDNIVSYIFYATILAYVYSLTGREPKEGSPMLKEFDEGFVDRLAFPAVLLIVIFTIYSVNITSIQANKTLIDALRPQETPKDNIRLFTEAVTANPPIGQQEIREQLIQGASRARSAGLPQDDQRALMALAVTEMRDHIASIEAKPGNPGDARLHLFLGSLLEGAQQFDLSHQHFLRAQELSPNKQTIRFTLAGNLINLGRVGEAMELMEETVALEPRFRESHIMWAVTAIYAGEDEKAEQILLDFYGDTTVDHARLIQAYAAVGNIPKVRDIWKLRVEKSPNNAQYWRSLSAAYIELNDFELAIEAIEKSIELDPSFAGIGNAAIEELRAGRKP